MKAFISAFREKLLLLIKALCNELGIELTHS